MKILSAAAIALLLLAGCSTTPDPPPSHPTWCNKDPKKEPHFHCNGSIYMPGHEPEECLPEEPPEPVVQKPVEPPKPDPIVGTYKIFYTGMPMKQSLLRVHSDNSAGTTGKYAEFRWSKDGDSYRFDWRQNNSGDPNSYPFSLKLQSAEGDPDIVTVYSKSNWYAFEGIKVSDDSELPFDLYRHSWRIEGDNYVSDCRNIGRYESGNHQAYSGPTTPRDYADSLEECQSLCPTIAEYQRRKYNSHPYICP